MCEYTIVSDIHANYPALEAVLEDAPDASGLICLGDIIGLCGFPGKTVDLLREETTYCLKGNHDVAVLEHTEGHVNSPELSTFELEHTHDILSQSQKSWVTSLSSYREITDLDLLIAHAKPTPERSSGYGRNSGLRGKDYVTASSRLPSWVETLAVGHTHEQKTVDCRKFDGDHGTTIVNPGSTGQPLRHHRATYAQLDTDTSTATLHDVDYETDAIFSRLHELDVPIKWWF